MLFESACQSSKQFNPSRAFIPDLLAARSGFIRASAGLPSVCLRICTVVLVPIYPSDGGSAVCYGDLPVIRCRTDVTCVQCVSAT